MEIINFYGKKSLFKKLNKDLKEYLIQYLNLVDLLKVVKLNKFFRNIVVKTSLIKIYSEFITYIRFYRKLSLDQFIYKESKILEKIFFSNQKLDITSEIFLRKLVILSLNSHRIAILEGDDIPVSFKHFKLNYLDKIKIENISYVIEINSEIVNKKKTLFLVDLLKNNENLNVLHFNIKRFDKKFFEEIIASIRIKRSMIEFHLFIFCKLDKDDGILIANHYKSLSQIVPKISFNQTYDRNSYDPSFLLEIMEDYEISMERLKMSNSQIFVQDIINLIKVLEKQKIQKELNFSNSYLELEGLKVLSEEIKKNKLIEVLNFSWSQIGAGGCMLIADTLRFNNTVKELNLLQTIIKDEAVSYLSDSLKINRGLERLILIGNIIGDNGCKALTEAITLNQYLKILNLSSNVITDEGLICLSEGLKQNRILEELDLSCNIIANRGAIALSEGLKDNFFLKKVNLYRNKIKDEGASSLLDTIKNNMILVHLNLKNNLISKNLLEKIEMQLKENYRKVV